MKKLIIFGNGKQAKCTSKMFQADIVETFGFCADDEYCKESTFLDKPLYKYSDFIKTCSPDEYIMFLPLSAMNRCRFRMEKFLLFKSLGYEFFTFISNRSHIYIGKEDMGSNVYIGDNVGIHPDVKLGDNIYLADYAIVGHDARINSHCFIASGAIIGASSVLGERVTIGIGAIIREDTQVIGGSVVGMGVAIHRNIEKPGVYAFTPIEEEHYGRQRNKRTIQGGN